MSGISKKTFDFLKDLGKNNDRDWFTENKPRYEEAKQEFEVFITDLIANIVAFDPLIADVKAKKAIFRIYRDTRFSKDKTPYKTNMGAHMVAYSLKPHDRAGYYIHIEPGKSMIAGGAYLPPGPWIKAIRQEIDYNPQEFKDIIGNVDFKKYFGDIEGDKLKTVPKGYAKDHPEIELLKHKSFLAANYLDDKAVLAPSFLQYSTDAFKAMKPFDDFLNRGLE